MKLRLLFLLSLLVSTAFSQDPSITQFYNNPNYINPAYTGVIQNNFRLTSMYRSQYGMNSRSGKFGLYKTAFIGSDIRIQTTTSGNAATFGFTYINDNSGFSTLSTNYFSMSMGSSIPVSKNSKVSLGLSAGMVSTTLEESFRLGHQWNGTQWDGSIDLLDDQAINDLSGLTRYPIAGAGIALLTKYNRTDKFFLGLSANNLNTPNVSFLEGGSINLAPTFNANMGFNNQVRQEIVLVNNLLARFQGQSYQVVANTTINYQPNFKSNSFNAGVGFRLTNGLNNAVAGESFILTTGYGVGEFTVQASVDINTQLDNAIEVAFIYTPAVKTARVHPLACPDISLPKF